MNEANQTLIVPEERKTRQLPATVSGMTPLGMIELAVQQNAPLEKLQQLMDLQERWEKNEARKAYVAAMAAFHADPPEVYKNKTVSYVTDKGTTTYKHVTLDRLASAVAEKMAPHGLSFRWRTTRKEGGMIEVSCIITHALGHSEEVSLEAGLDQSGGKNNIQALGSTVKYLERYTLEAAAGVASIDNADDDGRTAEPPKIKTISPEQVESLEAMITELGIDKAAYLKAGHLEKLEDLPANKFQNAIKILEKRRQGLGAK